uniref:F-box domain-containing protein n=1 Tax=Kalanchoe fedtschenkoi TaxID=63787 RepID=A0A7N0SYE0_KALFE
MAKRPCSASPDHHHHHHLHLHPHSARAVLDPPMATPSDSLLAAFLDAFDAPPSVHLAFDRLVESEDSDADREALIDRATRLGAALLEAGKRSARRRASALNSIIWPLPPDLTIKVFGLLDTQTLCYAAATCSMFHKCAMDPLCYVNINLLTKTPKVNNAVVSKLVQRAGRVLQSLKLGLVTNPYKLGGYVHPLMRSTDTKGSSILSRSCLTSLGGNNGATGALLKQLYLHNIERLDDSAVCAALSTCPSLLDLEIVGLNVELKQILVSVASSCSMIQRLYFDSSIAGRDDNLTAPICVDFVSNCPFLTSLSLRGCKLHDNKVRILIKGFHRLRHFDVSTSYSVTGSFLRNLGNTAGENILEVLILRDCMHLKKVEVSQFFDAILSGDFKHLRCLDISNREGLAPERVWDQRIYNPSFIPIKQLQELRPDLSLLAEFPSEACFTEFDILSEMGFTPDLSMPSDLCSLESVLNSSTTGGSMLISTSEGSYNTDSSSGNDDGINSSDLIPDESSDEVDFVAG